MSNLNVLTPSTIGLELHGPFGGQAWYLIAATDPEQAVKDVCEALEGAEVTHQRLAAPGPEALVSASPKVVACVPTGTWAWDEAAYIKLDRLRAAIREARPVLVWVTSPDAARRLIHRAPNFAAFFQPSAGTWADGSMSAADVETHLEALREEYGHSDKDVIDMATRGELPQDADHHTWLILLGRGDLIPGSRSRTS